MNFTSSFGGFFFINDMYRLYVVDTGELAAGDVLAVGAGEAILDPPGLPLLVKGGNARKANLVLQKSLVSYMLVITQVILNIYLQVEHTGDQLQKTIQAVNDYFTTSTTHMYCIFNLLDRHTEHI